VEYHFGKFNTCDNPSSLTNSFALPSAEAEYKPANYGRHRLHLLEWHLQLVSVTRFEIVLR
jgi:hypothetical protein